MQPRAAPTAAELKQLDSRLAPLLARVAVANTLKVTDEYVPQNSLQPDPARIGWDFVGHAYARRVRDAITRQDYDAAVTDAVGGTRFALIIACGDAPDSLVGLPIADEIRRALTPSLREFSPAQLSKLADGISGALFDRLPAQAVVSHERMAMFAALQAVQEAYRDGRLSALEQQLGPTVHESIDTLEGYRGRAESKRVAFFAAMAAEADEEAGWMTQAVAIPPYQRAKEPNPKASSKRPWTALARQFFLAGGPMAESQNRLDNRPYSHAGHLTCQASWHSQTRPAPRRATWIFFRSNSTRTRSQAEDSTTCRPGSIFVSTLPGRTGLITTASRTTCYWKDSTKWISECAV